MGRIDTAATAATLGALVCWSMGPIFIADLARYIDSWTQNALRYTVACLFWLPLLVHFIRTERFDRRTWKLAIPPTVANVMTQSLWAATFYYVAPAFATLLAQTSVLWVATFSLLFFADERPLAGSLRFWGGLILSGAGVFGVLYFKEDFGTHAITMGVLMALGWAFTWGLYAIMVKITMKSIDSRTGFAVISIYTTVALWAAMLLFGKPAQSLGMEPWPWTIVVVSGIVSIALGHVLYYAAIKRIGATIPLLVNLAQPIIVLGMSSVIFGERFNLPQLLSGLVLLLGAGLSIWAQGHLKSELSSADKKGCCMLRLLVV
jgi:drug/metabolite transporter (DMT)-like permease